MNDNWFKDIMIQKYQCDNYFDPTKLFIILSLLEDNELKESYSINEVAKYVYRYYLANIKIAKRNFNIIVRNIQKYGIEDIIPVVKLALNQWEKEQKNNSLTIYDSFIKLNLNEYDLKTLNLTRTMVETLFLKYYKVKLNKIYNYNEISLYDDSNIYSFNESLAKQLIFEDIQYCPLTEETNIEKLFAVHLYSLEDGATQEELCSKDNLMLFSEEVASDYLEKKFIIDEFGKINNIGNSQYVNNKMRLSINFLNSNRKRFIELHNNKIQVNN